MTEEIRKKINAKTTQPPILYGSGGLPLGASAQTTAPSVILPDESEVNFQQLVHYFEAAKSNAIQNQIAGLLKALEPYCEYFEEKEEPSSNIFKWRTDYRNLQIKFSHQQELETLLLEAVAQTKKMESLRGLKKDHFHLIKTMTVIKKGLEELNDRLVAGHVRLPKPQKDKSVASPDTNSSGVPAEGNSPIAMGVRKGRIAILPLHSEQSASPMRRI